MARKRNEWEDEDDVRPGRRPVGSEHEDEGLDDLDEFDPDELLDDEDDDELLDDDEFLEAEEEL